MHHLSEDTAILEAVTASGVLSLSEYGLIYFVESAFINFCFAMSGPLHLSWIGIGLGGICSYIALCAGWPGNPIAKLDD